MTVNSVHRISSLIQRICGVEFVLAYRSDGITLHSFGRLDCPNRYKASFDYEKPRRNQCEVRGAIALYMVCQWADMNGISLFLWTTVPRLYQWYESFGFFPIEHRNKTILYERTPL